MIDKDAYYIDKTNLIEEVLKEQVVLYTRPRRFARHSICHHALLFIF